MQNRVGGFFCKNIVQIKQTTSNEEHLQKLPPVNASVHFICQSHSPLLSTPAHDPARPELPPLLPPRARRGCPPRHRQPRAAGRRRHRAGDAHRARHPAAVGPPPDGTPAVREVSVRGQHRTPVQVTLTLIFVPLLHCVTISPAHVGPPPPSTLTRLHRTRRKLLTGVLQRF